MDTMGIVTGFRYQNEVYKKAREARRTDFYANISDAAKLTEERSSRPVLSMTMIPDGGNITYGMTAKYAEHSTDADPVIQVSSNYGGKTVIYNVNINEVNPQNASQLEMFALCAYSDDKGISQRGTFGSYQRMKVFGQNAEMNGYCSGLSGYRNFLDTKFNWMNIVSRMMNDYLQAGIYRQYRQGTQLMGMFNYFAKAF